MCVYFLLDYNQLN